MSLSWLERLTLVVEPTQAILVVRPWRRPAQEHALAVAPAAAGEAEWQPLAAATRALLAEHARPGAVLRIVLANPLVRYVLLPWSEAVLGDKARRNLARALLHNSYGEPAQRLELALDRPVYGQNGMAAAIEPALLAALRQVAREMRLCLRGLQPQLGADLAMLRHGLNDGCVLFESAGWQTLLGLQDGAIQLLHNHRATPGQAGRHELQAVLATEAAALVKRKNLQVFTTGDWPEQLDDWTVQRHAPLAAGTRHA